MRSGIIQTNEILTAWLKYGCMSLCNRDILRFMWRVQDKYVLVTRLCDARMRIRDHYKGDGRSGLGPIPSQFIAE